MWCLNIFVYFLYCFLGLSFWPAFIVLEYSIPWSIFSYNQLVKYFTLIIFCRLYWYEITFSDVLEGRRREQDFFFLNGFWAVSFIIFMKGLLFYGVYLFYEGLKNMALDLMGFFFSWFYSASLPPPHICIFSFLCFWSQQFLLIWGLCHRSPGRDLWQLLLKVHRTWPRPALLMSTDTCSHPVHVQLLPLPSTLLKLTCQYL